MDSENENNFSDETFSFSNKLMPEIRKDYDLTKIKEIELPHQAKTTELNQNDDSLSLSLGRPIRKSIYELIDTVLINPSLSDYICSKILTINLNENFSWALIRNSLQPKKRPDIDQWRIISELLLSNDYIILVNGGLVKRII